MKTSIKILITICLFFLLIGGSAIVLFSKNSDNQPPSPPSPPPSPLPLCSNFTCPADMVKDSSKVNGNTAQECCKAGSCADFDCVFPRVKKDPPGSGFSDETCCKDRPRGGSINCDAHTCSGNTLKKAGVGNTRCVRTPTVSLATLPPCSSVCCEPPLCSDSFTCVAPRIAISGARGTTDSECCKNPERPPGQPVQISSFSRNPTSFQGAYMIAENDEEFEKIQEGDIIRDSNGRLFGPTGKVLRTFLEREISDPILGSSAIFKVFNVVFLEGARLNTLSQWPENMPANSGPYTVFVA